MMEEAMSSSLGILCIVLVHGNLRMRLYRYGLQYRPLPRVAVRQRLRPIKDERMTRTRFCQSLSLASSVTRARTPRSGRLRVTYQFWCSPGWSLAIRRKLAGRAREDACIVHWGSTSMPRHIPFFRLLLYCFTLLRSLCVK